MRHDYVHELFTQVAQSFPARVALDGPAGHLTYQELESQANKLADLLRGSGVSQGALVGILTSHVDRIVTAMIGILKAGGAFVPLDTELPRQRLKAMIAESELQWLVTESALLEPLDTLLGDESPRLNVVCLDRSLSPAYKGRRIKVLSESEQGAPIQPTGDWKPDDLCYLYFTSGSTGRPKGIAGRLKAIDHFIRWEIQTFNLGEGARISQLVPPSFDAFLRDVFAPLCAGGTACVPPSRDVLRDAEQLSEWLDSQQITLVHCVPSVFRALLTTNLSAHSFSALQYILMAGEALLPADVKRWMNSCGERIRLVNLYGPSETTMVKTYHFVTASDQDRRIIPIGRPLPGTRLVVLNERGEVCPPEIVGEIYIRTPYRTLGYYRQPELTQEVFIQNPLSDDPSDIVYRTGDLGRVLRDGEIEFLGRKDQQVKIGGVRVELGEIESLLREHDLVQDVAVKDWDTSTHEKLLCAYIVAAAQLDSRQLKGFLRDYLPESLIPALFVQLEDLPRTLNGKIDRKALPDPREHFRRKVKLVAPQNSIEQKLVEIWTKILQIDQIGTHDDFFELGGHSLRGTQLLSIIHREFQVELPLRVLLERPTIAELALSIVEKRAEQISEAQMAQILADVQRSPEAATPAAKGSND